MALLTAEQYFDQPAPADGSKQELVRGEVVSEPCPGVQRGEVRGNVGFVIKRFLVAKPVGRVATSCGVVTERNPDTVRGPDASFYSIARLPLGLHVPKYHTEPPDLCVEVMSPSNSLRKLKDKAKEYLFAGVRAVWIVNPDERTVTIITEPLESRVLEAGATLDGGDVLPGFTCKVADLFE